jgi:hypothetical protein
MDSLRHGNDPVPVDIGSGFPSWPLAVYARHSRRQPDSTAFVDALAQ